MPRRSASPSTPSSSAYDDLLDIFFATHDPTQLNRQGNDIGTQYRSAIFPQDEGQEAEARAAIARAQEDSDKPIVTTIEPKAEWYPAEDYHQDYWAGEGQRNPYCLAVIPPKLQKLRKSFQARVKSAQREPELRPEQSAWTINRSLRRKKPVVAVALPMPASAHGSVLARRRVWGADLCEE